MPGRLCRGSSMADFLLAVATFILAMVALGLLRVKIGPDYADRMMSAMLLGSGCVAVLLLYGAATGMDGIIDVALTLALLAAFASIAFVHFGAARERDAADSDNPG